MTLYELEKHLTPLQRNAFRSLMRERLAANNNAVRNYMVDEACRKLSNRGPLDQRAAVAVTYPRGVLPTAEQIMARAEELARVVTP